MSQTADIARMPPTLGVVIPCYNEAARLDLRWCLAPTDVSPVITLTEALEGTRLVGRGSAGA